MLSQSDIESINNEASEIAFNIMELDDITLYLEWFRHSFVKHGTKRELAAIAMLHDRIARSISKWKECASSISVSLDILQRIVEKEKE